MTARTFSARAALVAVLLGTTAVPWVLAGGRAPGESLPAMPSAGEAAQGREATGDVEAGREVYGRTGCPACHGLEGQGSPATSGPRLGPNPMPLAAFILYTRRPSGAMPPYTERVLSDKQLTDMHAFLSSRPDPVSIDRIPSPR